jgi:hypothetical protein
MTPQMFAMFSMMNPAMMAGAPMMNPIAVGAPVGGKGSSANQEGTTVYISVAFFSPTVPLQSLFTLLEAFGGVVSIRRNHNRPEIVTVKMATPHDADACCKYMRQVPLAGLTLSAKHFGQYQERNPCTDDADPTVATTTQFDFTASRHRSPAQRSKASPSKLLKITMSQATEADLMTYFTQLNLFPENIRKEGDAFLVRMDSIEAAVKLLIECHGRVCNEERSNVLFVEDPNATAEAATAPVAESQVNAPVGESE